MSERDPLLVPISRRRRRLHPLVVALGVLVGMGGIAVLWISAFSSVLISPQEFYGRQKHLDRALRHLLQTHGDGEIPDLPAWPGSLSADRIKVLACVEAQAIRGVKHSNTTQSLEYPWGDLPDHIGTSADLMVRCLRAVDLDLQQLVHHDRKTDPKRYPLALFTRKTADKSLDHRRVAFLFTFAKRFLPDAGVELDTPEAKATFQPGDLVFWTAGGREGHPGLVGFVTDRRDESGMPLVATLHPDVGYLTSHHRLDTWTVVGHFSLDVDTLLERYLEAYPGLLQEPRPPAPAAPPVP